MMNETLELTDEEKNFLNELKEIIGDSNLKEIYIGRVNVNVNNGVIDLEKHKVKSLNEIVVGIKNEFPRGLIYTDKLFISTENLEVISIIPM